MTNDLQSLNIVPLSQPFSIAPFNYSGIESVSNFNFQASVCDWVLVDILDTTNNLILRKAALLKTNGHLLDVSNVGVDIGLEGIKIDNVTAASSFKVIVRHRNHLALSTLPNVVISPGQRTNLDLSVSQNILSNSQIEVTTNIFGLRKGNTDSNEKIGRAHV